MDYFCFILNFWLKFIEFRLISIKSFGFEVSINLLVENSDNKTEFLLAHKETVRSNHFIFLLFNFYLLFFLIKNYLSKIYFFFIIIFQNLFLLLLLKTIETNQLFYIFLEEH